MISGGFVPTGREALNLAITSSLSAICFTCFGETKLTASMSLNPASTASFKYSALNSVGMKSGSPFHASRGHSMSFTVSILGLQDSGLKLANFGVQRGRLQSLNQRIAGVGGIDDGVDP